MTAPPLPDPGAAAQRTLFPLFADLHRGAWWSAAAWRGAGSTRYGPPARASGSSHRAWTRRWTGWPPTGRSSTSTPRSGRTTSVCGRATPRDASRARTARSAGATVAAALHVAARAEPGAVVPAMLPDTGERYLGTFLSEGIEDDSDDAWLATLDADGARAPAIASAG